MWFAFYLSLMVKFKCWRFKRFHPSYNFLDNNFIGIYYSLLSSSLYQLFHSSCVFINWAKHYSQNSSFKNQQLLAACQFQYPRYSPLLASKHCMLSLHCIPKGTSWWWEKSLGWCYRMFVYNRWREGVYRFCLYVCPSVHPSVC